MGHVLPSTTIEGTTSPKDPGYGGMNSSFRGSMLVAQLAPLRSCKRGRVPCAQPMCRASESDGDGPNIARSAVVVCTMRLGEAIPTTPVTLGKRAGGHAPHLAGRLAPCDRLPDATGDGAP